MKTQMFLKGAMVAIVLFVGAALFAGTSMSGIQAGSAVRVIVPAGFSAVGNTESEPLTQAENVVNFTLHDDSY